MSEARKKRKISDEYRGFQEKWTENYLCIPSGTRVVCLVCDESISVMKKYNIERHYTQKHSEYNNIVDQNRKNLIFELTKYRNSQQTLLTENKKEVDNAVKKDPADMKRAKNSFDQRQKRSRPSEEMLHNPVPSSSSSHFPISSIGSYSVSEASQNSIDASAPFHQPPLVPTSQIMSEIPGAIDNVLLARIETLLETQGKRNREMLEAVEKRAAERHREIVETMRRISENLQHQFVAPHDREHLFEKPVGFPLKTLEEFDAFESDNKRQQNLKDYLQFVGGLSLREALSNFVKDSMSPQLVKEFSWTGRKNGPRDPLRPLFNTKIAKIFFNAASDGRHFPTFDRSEYANHMKEVLRSAKQRGRDERRRTMAPSGGRAKYNEEMANLYPSPGEEAASTINMPQFLESVGDTIPSFVGIKFTSTNLEEGTQALHANNNRFVVFLGSDQIMAGAFALGMNSAIGTSLNMFPELGLEVLKASNIGEAVKAREAQAKLSKAVITISKYGSWVETMKVAMALLTPIDVGPPRAPQTPVPAESVAAMKVDLRSLGYKLLS